MSPRTLTLVPAAIALAAAFIGTAAQARDVDVQWSVTIGTPVFTVPAPSVSVPPPVAVMPVYGQPVPRRATHQPAPPPPWAYREPTRWDVDGDGIPNRHDALYNPVWDRDGDRVPDRHAHRRHRGHDRDFDGIPDRHDRRDDRFDHRHGHRQGPRFDSHRGRRHDDHPGPR